MSKSKKPEKEPVVVVREIHHYHYYPRHSVLPQDTFYISRPYYPYTQIWCGNTSSGSGQYTINGSVG